MTAIAGNTLTGLTRLKIFYVLLLFSLLLIGSSVFMARMTFQQEFQVLKATPESSETTLDSRRESKKSRRGGRPNPN